MSLPRQERKLWVEKVRKAPANYCIQCSSDDPDAKYIQQKMGIPPAEVLAILSGRSNQNNLELSARVWPRHTIDGNDN